MVLSSSKRRFSRRDPGANLGTLSLSQLRESYLSGTGPVKNAYFIESMECAIGIVKPLF